MKRRQFLQSLQKMAVASSAVAVPTGRLFAAPEDYNGRFFVTVQAQGAWDVSSFCDPKINLPDEPEINHWARTAEVQEAGNIRYAPVANNQAFFEKHYAKTLVINGVDAQTNAHSTGVLHNWSGRNSAGFPSLTALFAKTHAPDLPLSYLNYGGYTETARLIRYTRLNDVNSLLSVLTPNIQPWNRERRFLHPEMLDLVKTRQQERLTRLQANQNLLPRTQYTQEAYYSARQNADGLENFASVIPSSDDLQSDNFLQQMQITTLAFKSGVACSADVVLGGFDTHADHDAEQMPALAELTTAIDYLWDYAEQQGIADRLTVMVASDFSRTPWYNSSDGKDHWPVGSVMFMEQGAPWANRVVQGTDGGQNALAIDTATLQASDTGSIIYPKHIHQSMRDYLGISNGSIDDAFSLNTTESFNFFGA